MKKRLFGVLLAFTLLLALATAAAADDTVATIGDETYTSLADAVADADDGATITVEGDDSDTTAINISNKSLTIVGSDDTKPTIANTFVIAHTSGSHTVSFEGIKFAPTTNKRVIDERSTNVTADSLNQLIIQDCDFYITAYGGANAVVAVSGTNGGTTGAQLTFKGNKVETASYTKAGSGSTNYSAVISTSAAPKDSGTIYNDDVYNFGRHVIEGNEFLGGFNYVYVGGYADFTGNTVDTQFLGADGEAVLGDRAFQFRGAYASNHGGQLDVHVAGNTFSNMDQLFKLYQLNTLINADGYTLDIAGSESNTFSNINRLGSVDGTAAVVGIEYSSSDMKAVNWGNGIADKTLAIVLAKVPLRQAGDEFVTGTMTMGNDGKQVMTYTQPVAPVEGGRTGLYWANASETKYWYFATLASNSAIHYFVDDNDAFYLVMLNGGSGTTTLTVDATGIIPDINDSSSFTEGTLYKTDFTISSDTLGNSYYNASAAKTGDTITLTANDVTAVNAFISSIGDYASLFVTDDKNAAAPSGALKLVVPTTSDTDKMAQLLVSGSFPVVIDADIANVSILGKCGVTVNSDNSVGTLGASGEAAVDTTVVNNGKIGTANLYARVTLENNGEIGDVHIGETTPGGVARRQGTFALSSGSVIENDGSIDALYLGGRADVTNNKDGSIQSLTIGYVGENLARPDGMPYATDSTIVNYGSLCNKDGEEHDIAINTRCTIDNKGTIGRDGRTHTTDGSCTKVGGVIGIGYGTGTYNYHDGVTITNSGTIFAGARHNSTTHQFYTFFIYDYIGAPVKINIYNEGEGKMYGGVYLYTQPGQDSKVETTLVDYKTSAGEKDVITTAMNLGISASPASLTNGGTVTLTVTGAQKDAELTFTCDVAGITVTDNYDGTYTVTLPDASRSYTFTVTDESGQYTASCTVRVSSPSVPDPNPITITQPANGTISTNFSNASVGATITVTATPNSGYELAYITVNGEKIDGNTFKMPDKAVTVSAVFVPATGGFADVVPGAWYVDAVNYVVSNGLMEGTSATTFEPEARMTRAMFWTILARIDGETITGATWADAARAWAVANNVSDGTNPHAPLTREQLVTMLWRYLGEPATTGSLTNFTDAVSVSAWAKTAMAWAIEKGIITGITPTTLAPQSTATRAQCATILMRNAF